MNGQRLVNLAACASKSGQEAKKAEAHARASRVYAKKAEKDARDAQVAAGRLLQFSRELLLRMLHTSDDEEVSMEDLDTLLKIADISDPVVNASTLHTIINCDRMKFDGSVPGCNLILNEDLISMIENKMESDKPRDSCSDSESDVNEKGSLKESIQNEQTPMELESSYFSPSSNRINLNLSSINPATNKRKMKQQKKSRATGAISPLLSKEEITIVKRATSPSTSQHSGISPHIGTHHKYSVRMKHSTLSLLSVVDDDERMTSTPMLITTQDESRSLAEQRPSSATQ